MLLRFHEVIKRMYGKSERSDWSVTIKQSLLRACVRSQLNKLLWMLRKVPGSVSYLKGFRVIVFISPGLLAHSDLVLEQTRACRR